MADTNNDNLTVAKRKSLTAAFKWVVGNSAIGLAPLLALIIMNPYIKNDAGGIEKEITHLLKGGIILFVCCALMGAVIIDILLEKRTFNLTTLTILILSPFAFLIIVCFLYIMTLTGSLEPTMFNSFSFLYCLIVLLSLGYCVYGKYYLLLDREKRKSKIISPENNS